MEKSNPGSPKRLTSMGVDVSKTKTEQIEEAGYTKQAMHKREQMAQAVVNQLDAIKILAKQEKGLSITKNRAGAYQLQVQRKVGQWGRALEKSKGKRTDITSSPQRDEVGTKQSQAKEAGYSKNELNKREQIANIEEDVFNEYISDERVQDAEVNA
ncbi:MAG: hypothetical protein GY941_23945 [Planctomycetes bacterium]|nr:hypothetical protein [Planctomycetota bacterium]